MLFDKPLAEESLRAALVSLCAEGGVSEEQLELELVDGAAPPRIWVATGLHRMNEYLPTVIGEDEYWAARGKSGKVVRLHVFNGAAAGEPTVVLYAGSLNAWDGSAHFISTRS